jgi:hypothetical protein
METIPYKDFDLLDDYINSLGKDGMLQTFEHCLSVEEYGVTNYLREKAKPVICELFPEINYNNLSNEGLFSLLGKAAAKTWEMIKKLLMWVLKKILPFIMRFFKWLFSKFLRVGATIAVKLANLLDTMTVNKDLELVKKGEEAHIINTGRSINESVFESKYWYSIQTKIDVILLDKTTHTLASAGSHIAATIRSLNKTLSDIDISNLSDSEYVEVLDLKVGSILTSLQDVSNGNIVFKKASQNTYHGEFMVVPVGGGKNNLIKVTPNTVMTNTQTVYPGNSVKNLLMNAESLDTTANYVLKASKDCLDTLTKVVPLHNKIITRLSTDETAKVDNQVRLLHSRLGGKMAAVTTMMHHIAALYVHVGLNPVEQLITDYISVKR